MASNGIKDVCYYSAAPKVINSKGVKDDRWKTKYNRQYV